MSPIDSNQTFHNLERSLIVISAEKENVTHRIFTFGDGSALARSGCCPPSVRFRARIEHGSMRINHIFHATFHVALFHLGL